MIVYDLATKQAELFVYSFRVVMDRLYLTMSYRSIPLDGELSSVKVSRDSRYALVNHPQDVSFLVELLTSHTHEHALLSRKYTCSISTQDDWHVSSQGNARTHMSSAAVLEVSTVTLW
jgi:hypothetical protein